MTVTEAAAEDLERLEMFYIQMNEVINRRTGHFDPDNPVFPSREMIAEAIRQHGLFFGTEDGAIVIACIVNHDAAPEYDRANWRQRLSREEYLVLHALRVHPDYERRGFARQMLEYVHAAAEKQGQKAIRLDVLEGYSAERLYIRCGYRYADTVSILYEDIGFPQRFRLWEKEIP